MHRFFVCFLFGLTLLLAAGCGGSGSGPSNLNYVTNWSGTDAGGITGASQRVAMYSLDGLLLSSAVLNNPGGSLQSFQFFLPNGSYHLSVELYALANLGGAKVGTIDTLVSINGTTSFRTEVGAAIVGAQVTPATATFQVQTSKQFYAAVTAASGHVTFSEPNGFTWQAFGGHVTVNETGLVLATSEGTGSIRATHGLSGEFNSATYTVEPFETTTTKWTVLVYINAANDLYPFSTLNMNQMEAVAQNPDVRFVVQWKQSQSLFPASSFNGTRRYLVKPDTTNQIASQLVQDMGSGVDMGQHSTLLDFVNWGETYFPGTRTCLIVWNHGNGWRRRPAPDEPISRAVSYDDETGNAIQIWQLGQALGSNHFDILAWDASLMQMLEVAYEVEDQASYVVGSEESPPGEGYPYDLIFQQFRDNPDNSTALLTKAFVDGMLAVPSYATRKITQSVLDTSKLDDLSNAISQFGTALQANSGTLSSDTIAIRNQSQSYSPTSNRVFRDLIDLCDRYLALSGLPIAVQTAAQDTKTAALAALVWEGHNTHSPGSRGISIDFSSGTTFAPSAADYANLKLAQLTQWNEWLTVAP